MARVFLIFIAVLFSPPLSAETILLKSGKELHAPIVENTKDYIGIKLNGGTVYYQHKYIDKILQDLAPEDDPAAPAKGERSLAAADNDDADQLIEGEKIKELDFYLLQGIESASSGDFSAASEAFMKGVSSHKNALGNINAALAIIDDINKGNVDKDFAVELFKGYYALYTGKYEQAALSLEKAMSFNYEDADLFYNSGVAYFGIKKYSRAVECFKRSLSIRPDDPEACAWISKAYDSLGDHSQSRQYSSLANVLIEKTSGNKI